ncbi:MAG: thioredoxin family protein [Verrucomicrobiota bacterium]
MNKRFFNTLYLALALTFLFAAISWSAPEIGKPAPAFTLTDTNGTSHNLSDFKGKFVVLEWVNHGCPFVKKFYTPGKMQELQSTYTGKDVVWLSICSSAAGKQGYMSAKDWNAKIKSTGTQATAVLLDTDGTVGKAYDAKTTPHMYVINPEGNLIYAGAIDSVKSASPEDIPAATNYVALALDEAMAGKPVSTPTSQAYGCSVKY